MDYWWEFQVRLACPGPIAGRWMFDTPTFSMCYGADLIRKSKEAGGSPECYSSGMWNSMGPPSDNPNCLKMNVVILFNLSNDVLNHSVGSDSIEIKLENIYQYISGPRVELQRVTLDGIWAEKTQKANPDGWQIFSWWWQKTIMKILLVIAYRMF